MEIKDYNYFIDREKNKPCLVAGNAPSIGNFPYSHFKGVYFMVNSGPVLLKRKAYPDYWLTANYINYIPHIHFKKINKFKDCVYVFSDTATYCQRNVYDYNLLKSKLNLRWFAFDDRHIEHKKCNPILGCCKLVDLYPGRVTIYEYIKDHFGLVKLCPKPGTSVVPSLIFAILMRCSPIYLQGIELPMYMKDYHQFGGFRLENAYNIYWPLRSYFRRLINGEHEKSGFANGYDSTLAAFEYLVNICNKLGIEIYNLSPTSALNKIKILPYMDYRKVCA